MFKVLYLQCSFARCHWHSEISLLVLQVDQEIANAFKLWIDVTFTYLTFIFTDITCTFNDITFTFTDITLTFTDQYFNFIFRLISKLRVLSNFGVMSLTSLSLQGTMEG